MKKDTLTDKQFLLVLNGPSCGGKSTTSKLLCEKYGNIFTAKSDVLKWLISDYDSETHRGFVHDLTTEVMKFALAQGFSVIKEGGLYELEEYIKLANHMNIPVFVINIEASWEVVLSRFEERVKARKSGAKIANTDPVRLRELYDMYLGTKSVADITFDSSQQSPEEIGEAVVSYIKKSI